MIKIKNSAQSRLRFRMDPQWQYNALMWIEDNQLDLVGIYHSHPSGPETVSATDIDEAAYEAVHLIWSCLNNTWNLKGFWINEKKIAEVHLEIE